MPKTNAAHQLKKIPKYIEKSFTPDPPQEGQFLALAAPAYSANQQKDYLKALKYIEENILGTPLESWTPEFVETLIKKLHEVAGKTVVESPYSGCTPKGIKSGEYRKESIHALKTPSSPDKEYFELDAPEDICLDLMRAYDQKTASDYMKWWLKFMRTVGGSYSDSTNSHHVLVLTNLGLNLEDRLLTFLFGTPSENSTAEELALEQQAIAKWRKDFFEGLELKDWMFNFVKGTGKAHYTKEEVAIDQKYLHEKAKVDMTDRASRPGLYTKDEIRARDLAIKFFMSPGQVPAEMQKFSRELIAMIQSKDASPIDIAVFAHQRLTNSHAFPNGIGRVTRMFCNIILMGYGYYPIAFDLSKESKRNYHKTVEAADTDPHLLKALFLQNIQQHTANDFCLAAQKGDRQSLTTRLQLQMDVNEKGPANCTALHYACKNVNLALAANTASANTAANTSNGANSAANTNADEDAKKKEEASQKISDDATQKLANAKDTTLFLVGNGASVTFQNKSGKTPLQTCGDTKDAKDFAEVLKAFQAESAADKALGSNGKQLQTTQPKVLKKHQYWHNLVNCQ